MGISYIPDSCRSPDLMGSTAAKSGVIMKYPICFLIATSLVASFPVMSSSRMAGPDKGVGPQKVSSVGKTVVRTRQQFMTYLRSTPTSPLHKLSDAKLSSFIDSLVFVPAGLGSLSYVELEGLSRSDVMEVLSIFGLEQEARELLNMQPKTSGMQVSRRVKRAAPQKRLHHSCVLRPGGLRGHCLPDPGRVCSTVCVN